MPLLEESERCNTIVRRVTSAQTLDPFLYVRKLYSSGWLRPKLGGQTKGRKGENKLFLRVAKPLCPIACPLELLPSCRERQFLRKKAEERQMGQSVGVMLP